MITEEMRLPLIWKHLFSYLLANHQIFSFVWPFCSDMLRRVWHRWRCSGYLSTTTEWQQSSVAAMVAVAVPANRSQMVSPRWRQLLKNDSSKVMFQTDLTRISDPLAAAGLRNGVPRGNAQTELRLESWLNMNKDMGRAIASSEAFLKEQRFHDNSTCSYN